jgi:peptidoglycan/LPS O-acetylase OafA/YrhL
MSDGSVAAKEAPMRRIGWFLVVVGASIGLLWVVLLGTGQVPEVTEGRVDIWFHVAAELGAAALLVSAGIATLREATRARLLAAAAVGALAYTTVNSAGYYAEQGDWAMVAMFGLLGVVTALAAVRLLRATGEPATSDDVVVEVH